MLGLSEENKVEHPLAAQFRTEALSEKPPIIELQDINHKPVGAIYLSNLKYKVFSVTETNNSEKYFLYLDGIGIYFSFYRKIVP